LYAKPIFRKPASRPHQQSILRRRFVFGVAGVVVPDVGFTVVRKPSRNPPAITDVRHQLHRNAPRRTVHTPSLPAPGWMEIMQQRRERYPKLLEREQFDVRAVFRERFAQTPSLPAPAAEWRPVAKAYRLAARDRHHAVQQSKFVSTKAIVVGWTSVQKIRPRVARRMRNVAQRIKFISTKAAAIPGRDIGWLVAYMIKRWYGHNIRR
jgi:hypothetical protein